MPQPGIPSQPMIAIPDEMDLIKVLQWDDPTQVDRDTNDKLREGKIAKEILTSVGIRFVVVSGEVATVIEVSKAVEVWDKGKLIYHSKDDRTTKFLENDVYRAQRIADCLTSYVDPSFGESFSLASTVSQMLHALDGFFDENDLDKEKYMKLTYKELCDRLWTAYTVYNDIPY